MKIRKIWSSSPHETCQSYLLFSSRHFWQLIPLLVDRRAQHRMQCPARGQPFHIALAWPNMSRPDASPLADAYGFESRPGLRIINALASFEARFVYRLHLEPMMKRPVHASIVLLGHPIARVPSRALSAIQVRIAGRNLARHYDPLFAVGSFFRYLRLI